MQLKIEGLPSQQTNIQKLVSSAYNHMLLLTLFLQEAKVDLVSAKLDQLIGFCSEEADDKDKSSMANAQSVCSLEALVAVACSTKISTSAYSDIWSTKSSSSCMARSSP